MPCLHGYGGCITILHVLLISCTLVVCITSADGLHCAVTALKWLHPPSLFRAVSHCVLTPVLWQVPGLETYRPLLERNIATAAASGTAAGGSRPQQQKLLFTPGPLNTSSAVKAAMQVRLAGGGGHRHTAKQACTINASLCVSVINGFACADVWVSHAKLTDP